MIPKSAKNCFLILLLDRDQTSLFSMTLIEARKEALRMSEYNSDALSAEHYRSLASKLSALIDHAERAPWIEHKNDNSPAT